jgi:hypothetical protein
MDHSGQPSVVLSDKGDAFCVTGVGSIEWRWQE